MDKLIDWLFNNFIISPNIALVIVILLTVLVIFFISIYTIAFIQDKNISFWPPTIGKTSHITQTSTKSNLKLERWIGHWEGKADDIKVESEEGELDAGTLFDQILEIELSSINGFTVILSGKITFDIDEHGKQIRLTGKLSGKAALEEEFLIMDYKVTSDTFETVGTSLLTLSGSGLQARGYYLSRRSFSDVSKGFGKVVFERKNL